MTRFAGLADLTIFFEGKCRNESKVASAQTDKTQDAATNSLHYETVKVKVIHPHVAAFVVPFYMCNLFRNKRKHARLVVKSQD